MLQFGTFHWRLPIAFGLVAALAFTVGSNWSARGATPPTVFYACLNQGMLKDVRLRTC